MRHGGKNTGYIFLLFFFTRALVEKKGNSLAPSGHNLFQKIFYARPQGRKVLSTERHKNVFMCDGSIFASFVALCRLSLEVEVLK